MGTSLSCAGKSVSSQQRRNNEDLIEQYSPVRRNDDKYNRCNDGNEDDFNSECESQQSCQLEEVLQQSRDAGEESAQLLRERMPIITDSQGDNERAHGAPGIALINKACFKMYPEQRNPLVATSSVKFWLGGPDPLDYVTMFYNAGDPANKVPEHWHYIGYGLSDLHGDGRVHRRAPDSKVSGFGFELTFRLQKQEEDIAPMWPGVLMNTLAKYVFSTGNVLNVGDHVPYGQSLSGEVSSHVEALLLAEDPQLRTVTGKLGSVQFRQIVGVVDMELRAAQRWNGAGVLNLLAKVDETGGPLLITDMRRQRDVFDLVPFFNHVAREGVDREGSGLGGVTANCLWADGTGSTPVAAGDTPQPLQHAHLTLDLEAGELMPLIARGRLRKGKHFTFCNAQRHTITFLPEQMLGLDGVFVTSAAPVVFNKEHLQILCYQSTVSRMTKIFKVLNNLNKAADQLPLEFSLQSPDVTIVIVYRIR